MRKPYDPTPLPGRSAFDPGSRGFRALAVVAAVVVLGAAFFAWQSRARPETVAPPRESAATPASAQIVVAVSGKVHKPGLVRLPIGSRVADAIEAAGGVLPGTDLSAVNLARKLTDGELIAIGVDSGASPGGKVNLNTATPAQLDSLPGVGPVLAQRIIDYRTQHGGFKSISELRQIEGIGEETFARLKELVTL